MLKPSGLGIGWGVSCMVGMVWLACSLACLVYPGDWLEGLAGSGWSGFLLGWVSQGIGFEIGLVGMVWVLACLIGLAWGLCKGSGWSGWSGFQPAWLGLPPDWPKVGAVGMVWFRAFLIGLAQAFAWGVGLLGMVWFPACSMGCMVGLAYGVAGWLGCLGGWDFRFA